MKIMVIGAGYVGLANAFMIGMTKEVTLVDLDEQKINSLQSGISPINDNYINKYIKKVKVNYCLPSSELYQNSDVIFIATNTDYDEESKNFNLDSIYNVVDEISKTNYQNKIIVIKSTIPLDLTKQVAQKLTGAKVLFSPEFLREGFALHDNLFPDRIVVGHDNVDSKTVKYIISLLKDNVMSEANVDVIECSTNEAEVVKLFANTYLAARLAFVNELDTFCMAKNLDAKNVISAIGADHRIGMQYFNPSFGFGGYCLPKDTRQLKSEFECLGIEAPLIFNIYGANENRIVAIYEEIKKIIDEKSLKTIGIYRVIAKKGINNFRSSAILKLLQHLKLIGVEIIIHEPLIEENNFYDCEIVNDIKLFNDKTELIVANRMSDEIDPQKTFSRDVFLEN